MSNYYQCQITKKILSLSFGELIDIVNTCGFNVPNLTDKTLRIELNSESQAVVFKWEKIENQPLSSVREERK